MNASELMTRDVFTCSAADDLSVAAALMWEHDCGCVPVVDAQHRPIAMLTDRDICMAAYTQGMPLRAITVSSAASQKLHRVSVSDTLETVEALMRREQVHRVPVVDQAGRLVGLISLNDLARQAARPGVRKANGLTPVGVAQTLASICETPAEHARATA